MKSNLRILILGASGQIGMVIRRRIHLAQPSATLICTSRRQAPESTSDAEIWVQFDPFQEDWSGLGRADLLINAVGVISETKKMPYEKVHIELTQRILDHRMKIGHPRIIQISALGADIEHQVGFLRTKGLADTLLLAEPETVVVRPSIVCTEGTMLQQKLENIVDMGRFSLGKMLVPKGFPDTQIQAIMPDDFGDLIAGIVADKRISGIVEAVGPERLTFRDLISIIATSKGKKLKLIEVSREIMNGFVKYFLSLWFPGTLNYDQFRLLFEDNIGDVTNLESILGRQAQRTRNFWEKSSGEELIKNGLHVQN